MSVTCTCGRDMDPTAAFCRHCRGTLEYALANIAAYWTDLTTLRTKQTRYGQAQGGATSRETALPFDTRFAAGGKGHRVRAYAGNTVTTWTRYVLDHTMRPDPGSACLTCRHHTCKRIRQGQAPREDSVVACCMFLARYSDWIRVCPVGQEILTDLVTVEHQLERLVDRPPDQWMAGVCGALTWAEDGSIVRCDRRLFAEPGQTFVRCRDCGATHDVADRRDALLVEAEGEDATVEAIAKFVSVLSDAGGSTAQLSARIRQWVSRGKLDPRGAEVVGGRHRPTYRIGDVLDLVLGERPEPEDADSRHADDQPHHATA